MGDPVADDGGGHAPAAAVELWHETGLRSAHAIVRDRRIASITPPYPGEFLPARNHPMFDKMGGFKGGGVLLRFAWVGERFDVHRDFADHAGPDVLADVYQAADIGDPDPTGRAGGFLWRGHQNSYWCSRIYRTAGPSLRLIGAELRLVDPGRNRGTWIHADPATATNLTQLITLIGQGLDIAVNGEPLTVNNIQNLPIPAPPPRRSWFARIRGN